MESDQPIRRYLTNFDSTRTGNVFTDVLVIGQGVAGMSAAREAAQHCDVILLAKGGMENSSTFMAQGGIAAASTEQDSVERHVRDTLRVGGGLNRKSAVELICREGPQRIRELTEDGLLFDRTAGAIDLGLEGGHSQPRVLHAGGDATGRALSAFLNDKIRQSTALRIFEGCFLIDLLTLDGECVGAVTFHQQYGHQLIWATRTILASGGFGQIFRETSNPPGITGDGIAAAFRAGGRIGDSEMIQFHPTTLYVAGSTRALISEAVRGEGAHLVDRSGKRFMDDYHADGELAPRDVVSRAIGDRLRATGETCVYLDVRHLGGERFAARFPSITARCQDFGINVHRDLIPVRPAAHFSIGGAITDLEGRTSLNGLFCCGEASCTGVHGANRLASNSLLEGLVLGKIAGRAAADDVAANSKGLRNLRIRNENPWSPKTLLDLADVRQSLRSLMWRNAGIVRHGDRLAETLEIIEFWSKFVLDKTFNEPAGWEIQNMLQLGRMLAAAALGRTESRGVHFRTDGADQPNDEPARHLAFTLHEGQPVLSSLDVDFQEAE